MPFDIGTQNDAASTSFIRQRRDLFVISLILVIWQFAEMRLPKQLSLFGTNIEIGRPDVLFYAAWVLWGYWVWRYWQAFNAVSSNLVHAHEKRLGRLLEQQFHREAELRTKEGIADKPSLGPRPPRIQTQEWTDEGYRYVWHAVARPPGTRSDSVVGEGLITDIKGATLKLCYLRAVLSVFVNDMAFTEYVLPFLVGVSPLIVLLLTCSTPELVLLSDPR